MEEICYGSRWREESKWLIQRGTPLLYRIVLGVATMIVDLYFA